jgi:hypothetical protein
LAVEKKGYLTMEQVKCPTTCISRALWLYTVVSINPYTSRASNRYPEGHGFDSYQGLRFFLSLISVLVLRKNQLQRYLITCTQLSIYLLLNPYPVSSAILIMGKYS